MTGIPILTFTPLGDWADNPARACAGCDTEAWFPELGTGGHNTTRRAKKICATCVVHDQCLDYALNAEPRVFGIWGGTTERERNEMRMQRRAVL